MQIAATSEKVSSPICLGTGAKLLKTSKFPVELGLHTGRLAPTQPGSLFQARVGRFQFLHPTGELKWMNTSVQSVGVRRFR